MNLRKLGPIALIALAGASPALAQSTTVTGTTGAGSIANVTCADIATLPAAYQAALIYYAAGYRDGMNASSTSSSAGSTDMSSSSSSDTTTSSSDSSSSSSSAATDTTSSSSSSDMSGTDTSSSSSSSTGGMSGEAMLGGLGLQAQDIVTACGDASAATQLLVDVIGQHGGSAGMGGTSGAGSTTDTSSSSSDMSSSSSSDMSSSSDTMSSDSSSSSSAQ